MAEGSRSPHTDNLGVGGWPRGPRSLYLRRCDHAGFGFTLRHFIVYPPDSYTVLAGDRRLGLRAGALHEPMDTIFVKHVKAGSPADRAGLRTGDRVVSVNGEAVAGHSYASVVQRIHNSAPGLHLLVVPPEHDILQLYFTETAHRPESNLEPMVGVRRPSEQDHQDNMAVAGCRLSLDPGLIGRRDSASHEGSASSLGSSDDSGIISRIFRSTEQKEEFLRRPAGPLWPAPAPAPTPGIKEFYARPQKLQPPPHWPPNIPTSPNHSPSRREREDTPPRERVSSQSCERRPRQAVVNPLNRIYESDSNPHHHQQASSPPPLHNPHPHPHQHPQLQVVSQRARQFESGSAPDRVSLHRSELSRLSHKHMVPDVTVRARQFESRADYQRPNNNGAPTAMVGNRLIPVGSRNIHCEPYESAGEKASWPGDAWPQRHKAVRQDSYLAACHRPTPPTPPAAEGEEGGIASVPPPIPEIRVEGAPRAARPTTLDLPGPDAEFSGTEDSGTGSTPHGSPSVMWRDKTIPETGSEEDRVTRRVSYLKATWPDRMTVDSDPDASDSEPPVRPPRKWRPPLFPDDIQKIRRLFEDHSAKRKRLIGPRHSLCEELDKENVHITHEGLLHCKLTLIDGKRATDRSWKQVWAVLRGPLLSLYKERRDSLPLPDTPVGMEVAVEQVDVRCATVSATEHTKRKHVLSLKTPSGSELLLQAADTAQMARWIVTLEEQANNNTQDANVSPATAEKGPRKLASLRNRSPTGQSPVTKTRKPSQQVVAVEPSSSPKSKTWKGRVARQLRRMQHSGGSPVSPSQPPSWPEGATIGVPLEHCPPSATNEFVPLLVELCTGIVDSSGLDIIGIYRVPGNTAAVSSLTEAVNRGLDSAVLSQDQRWTDVNVISSLLKSFFRRLPDALLTTELYPSFIQADKIADPHLRVATIRKLVHDLPDHHYETLRHLLMHLKRVVQHSATNKMEARNLAIVFGPTLVRAADDNMVTMVTDMSHQCRIVETLILHVDWCFGDEAVERLKLNGEEERGEPDPALAPNDLLLSNIHKVEGMTKELSARDIVSSIICAANRKMMKSKGRKAAEDSTDHAATTDSKQMKSRSQHRKDRLSSADESSLECQPPFVPVLVSEPVPSATSATTISNTTSTTNTATDVDSMLSPHHHESLSNPEGSVTRPAGDGAINSYKGLSAYTQERIRRFEMETKAMLQRERDAARSRRLDSDAEREQSKRELDVDDQLNTAVVGRLVEMGRGASGGSRPLAIVTPALRRGSSVEDVSMPASSITTTTTTNGDLKRFKAATLQVEGVLGRTSSLDSVHDLVACDQLPSHNDDEGGDLLVSLTSTFDAKLRSLLSNGTADTPDAQLNPHHHHPRSKPIFSDPSLHKACDKEEKEDESKEECCPDTDKSELSETTQTEMKKRLDNAAPSERVVRLQRSESVNKEDRMSRSESLKLRRSESLNKETRGELNSKLKRSDSLTKNEKTESNLNKRRQLEAGRWLKRKPGSALDRSIKRRHTVGGTKDFDKVNWLDNRQREAAEEGKERRTSSPDLSSGRTAGIVLRPLSLATERVPLESHV